MIILITGLPGSGKTTLAQKLGLDMPYFYWLNGDAFRKVYQDWDFSDEGRMRQAMRIAKCAKKYDFAICDFVCPREMYRLIIGADIVVYMNTIKESEYADTNAVFEPPSYYDFIVNNFDEIDDVVKEIKDRVDQAKTVPIYMDT